MLAGLAGLMVLMRLAGQAQLDDGGGWAPWVLMRL